ncbi:MAG: gliding motility-associated C-terminal domain-containing protein [Bacteroidota bacterium]
MKKKYTIALLVCFVGLMGLNPANGQVVVINELCVSPFDAAGVTNANSLYNTLESPADNQEWIELYNTTCSPVDISCYTLGSNMQQPSVLGGFNENWGAFTFPVGTVIPAFGFLIIGGNHAVVPVLNFNLNTYRTNNFGVQYLDGEPTRWFLRNTYGWLALYNPAGIPVDAVYWDEYGNASNLYSQNEYQQAVVTTTSCGGTQTLAAAVNISGIEYIGACSPNTYTSFQRAIDGSMTWTPIPTTPTPGACNGPCKVAPVLNTTPQNVSCAGGDGSINMSITDGYTGPYTVNWLNPTGIHTTNVNGLDAGTYVVQVVDASNCFIVYDTIILTQAPQPSISLANIHNETCSLANGGATANVSNGNLPINYHWNTTPAAVSQTLSGVPAGDYVVSISDGLGCTASNSVALVNYPGPQLAIDSLRNEMCSAADGAVYTSYSGGVAPYQFVWNSVPVQHVQNLTGVHAGTYMLVLTDSNGCIASMDTSLTDTPPPHLFFSNIQADTCNKRTGGVGVQAYGGSPPYSYAWQNFAMITLPYLSQLFEGTYTVSVTDSFCTTVASVFVPTIPGPQADFKFYPPIATIEDATFRLEDWSVGNMDHWHWDFGNGTSSDIQSPFHNYTEVGIYDVMLVITNEYGCRDSIIKKITVMSPINLYVPNCFTPNGDGKNDYFNVFAQNICDFDLYLYNRWGEMIYHSASVDDYWNGTYKGATVPEGIYNWVIDYSENWAEIRKIPKTMKGTLTIIR